MAAIRPAPMLGHGDIVTSRSALLATRLLISSYFVVVGLCLVEDPILYTLIAPGVLSTATAQSFQVLVLLSAGLIMAARFVRPAALFLIVFTLVSAGLHFYLNWGANTLELVWREVSLIGALLMIALTARPVMLEIRGLTNRNVAIRPRRIRIEDDETESLFEARDEEDDQTKTKAQSQVDRGEISNLFHDLWDDSTPIRARTGTA